MSKLKCYYAHPMLSYNSTIEQKDLILLEKLGFEVENPNQETHQKGCQDYAAKFGGDKVMDYFKLIVEDCELVAFRSMPNGEILSGVGVEVEHAININIPVIELPSNITRRTLDRW